MRISFELLLATTLFSSWVGFSLLRDVRHGSISAFDHLQHVAEARVPAVAQPLERHHLVAHDAWRRPAPGAASPARGRPAGASRRRRHHPHAQAGAPTGPVPSAAGTHGPRNRRSRPGARRPGASSVDSRPSAQASKCILGSVDRTALRAALDVRPQAGGVLLGAERPACPAPRPRGPGRRASAPPRLAAVRWPASGVPGSRPGPARCCGVDRFIASSAPAAGLAARPSSLPTVALEEVLARPAEHADAAGVAEQQQAHACARTAPSPRPCACVGAEAERRAGPSCAAQRIAQARR